MFAIDSSATAGTTNGVVAIIYDLFTGDPNTDPNATQIGGDTFAVLPASITVNAESAPEPGSVVLVGLGLAGALLRRRLRGKSLFSEQAVCLDRRHLVQKIR